MYERQRYTEMIKNTQDLGSSGTKVDFPKTCQAVSVLQGLTHARKIWINTI